VRSKLEKAKIELELIKVSAAKAEMEFKVLEREIEIERLMENLEIQENKIQELRKSLEGE
jgi:glutathionylspermidine synthase